MCGKGGESDFSIGMGGVMLQSLEWTGGLRDRVLPMNAKHCNSVRKSIHTTISLLAGNVFKYHGI
jgi:hypothetical protein